MKNSKIVTNKVKSWRKRIVLFGALAIVAGYLFLPKQNTSQNDENIIPIEHQNNRLSYFSFSELELITEGSKTYVINDITNNSHIYNLKNTKVEVSYFEDEAMQNLIKTENYTIPLINSGETFNLKYEVDKESLPSNWYVSVLVVDTKLSEK